MGLSTAPYQCGMALSAEPQTLSLHICGQSEILRFHTHSLNLLNRMWNSQSKMFHEEEKTGKLRKGAIL